MIKLTKVQQQTARALATLTKENPQKRFFTAEEVKVERLRDIRPAKKNEKTYLRTTRTALTQLSQVVPVLVAKTKVGWSLTDTGVVLSRTQLEVDI